MKEGKNDQTIYDIGTILRNAGKKAFPNLSETPLGKALSLDPKADSLDKTAKTNMLETIDAVRDSLIPNMDETVAESRAELARYENLTAEVQSHFDATVEKQETITDTIDNLKKDYEAAVEEIRKTGKVNDEMLSTLNGYVDTLEGMKPDTITLTRYTQEADRLRREEVSNFQSNPEQDKDSLQNMRDEIAALQAPIDRTAKAHLFVNMVNKFNLAADAFVLEAQTSRDQEQQLLIDLEETRATQADSIEDAVEYQTTLTKDIQTLQEAIKAGNIEKIFPDLDHLQNTLGDLSDENAFQDLRKTALKAQAAYLTNHVRNLKELKLNSISFADDDHIDVLVGNIEGRLHNLRSIDLSGNKDISTEQFLKLLDKLSAERQDLEVKFSDTKLSAALKIQEANLTVADAVKRTEEWDKNINEIRKIPKEFEERITKLNITFDDVTLDRDTTKSLSSQFDKFPRLRSLDLSNGPVENLETIEILFNSLKNDAVRIKVSHDDQETLGLEKQEFSKEEFFNFLKERKAEQSLQKADQEKRDKQEAVEPQRTKQPEEVQQKATEPEQTASKSPQEKAATTIQRAFRNFKDRNESSLDDLLKETDSLLAEKKTQDGKLNEIGERLNNVEEEINAFLREEEAQKKIYKDAEPESPEEQPENLAAELARENLTPDFQETPESFLDEDKTQREVEEKASQRAEAQQAAEKGIESTKARIAKAREDEQREQEAQKAKAEAETKAAAAAKEAEARQKALRAQERLQGLRTTREIRAQEAAITAMKAAQERLRETRAQEAAEDAIKSASERNAKLERQIQAELKAQDKAAQDNLDKAKAAAEASAKKRNDEADKEAAQKDEEEKKLRDSAAEAAIKSAKERNDKLEQQILAELEAQDKAAADNAEMVDVKTNAEEDAEAARLRMEDLEVDVAGFKQEVRIIERDLKEVSNSWGAWLGGRKEEISALQEKLEKAKKELAKAELALESVQQKAISAPAEPERQAAQTIQKVYRGRLARKEANKLRADKAAQQSIAIEPGPAANVEKAAEAQKEGSGPKKSKASTAPDKQTVQPDAEVSHRDGRTKSIYEAIVEASAYNFVTRAAQPGAEELSYSAYIQEMFEPTPDPAAHLTHREEREENLRKTHIEITKQKITPTRQEGGKVKEYDIGSVGGERLQLRETTEAGKITFNLEEIMNKGGSCSISVSRKPDASGKAGHDIIEIIDGELRTVALSEVGESKLNQEQLDKLVQMQKTVEQRAPQYKPRERGGRGR
jgi:hypothetical protein